jgi:hypothetical protein
MSQSPGPQTVYLNDPFAQRLIMVAKQDILAGRRDLSAPIPSPSGRGLG